jgi:glycosyltransferase A (GT-A) superfamily protein (DUF2064 family)
VASSAQSGAAREAANGGARVLLLARAPEAQPHRPEVEALLGPARYVRLEQLLIERASAWAAEVAPGHVYVACQPGGDESALRPLVGADVPVFAQVGDGVSRRLHGAVQRVFSEGEGPVLVAWPDLPHWRPAHMAGALGDLRAGCDVSVGPVFDGGFYLLALARLVPALFELPDDDWRSPGSMGRLLGVAHEAGLQPGLLRAERGMSRPADVRAALADPLLDDELAAVLRDGS